MFDRREIIVAGRTSFVVRVLFVLALISGAYFAVVQSWSGPDADIALSLFIFVLILDLVVSTSGYIQSVFSGRRSPLDSSSSDSNSSSDVLLPLMSSVGIRSDRPIEGFNEDMLDFAKYAFVLASTIVRCETPMTIGIHAEWGAGKTSLANLIAEFLKKRDGNKWEEDKTLLAMLGRFQDHGYSIDEHLPNKKLENIIVLKVNAWQYRSSEALWRHTILRLIGLLEDEGTDLDINKIRNQLYYSVTRTENDRVELNWLATVQVLFQFAINILGYIILPTNLLFHLLRALGMRLVTEDGPTRLDDLVEQKKNQLTRERMTSLEEFRSAFGMLVSALLNSQSVEGLGDRRIVFIIDDLDRCLPTVALEIAEAIKLFLEVPGTVFLLLCDEDLIGQGVNEKYKNISFENRSLQSQGRDYVEKIIQTPFRIPSQKREALESYLDESLRNIYPKIGTPYFKIVHSAVGGNPRKLIRISRGIELAFDVMRISKATIEHNLIFNSPMKRNFAKVFCLHYVWPEAILPLMSYLETEELPMEPFPAAIEKKMKYLIENEPDNPKFIEYQNMYEAYQHLSSLLSHNDRKIFGNLLVAVDWEKSRLMGKNAVSRKLTGLWEFINAPPYFTKDMTIDEIRSYLEWSVISSRIVTEVSPLDLYASESVASTVKGQYVEGMRDTIENPKSQQNPWEIGLSDSVKMFRSETNEGVPAYAPNFEDFDPIAFSFRDTVENAPTCIEKINRLPREDLRGIDGIRLYQVNLILEKRPFQNLDELRKLDEIAPGLFLRLVSYVCSDDHTLHETAT